MAAAGGHLLLYPTGTVIRSCGMPFLLLLLLRDSREMFDRTVRLVPMEPQRRWEPFVDATLAGRP